MPSLQPCAAALLHSTACMQHHTYSQSHSHVWPALFQDAFARERRLARRHHHRRVILFEPIPRHHSAAAHQAGQLRGRLGRARRRAERWRQPPRGRRRRRRCAGIADLCAVCLAAFRVCTCGGVDGGWGASLSVNVWNRSRVDQFMRAKRENSLGLAQQTGDAENDAAAHAVATGPRPIQLATKSVMRVRTPLTTNQPLRHPTHTLPNSTSLSRRAAATASPLPAGGAATAALADGGSAPSCAPPSSGAGSSGMAAGSGGAYPGG